MAQNILIKPIISEKAESLSDKKQQYTFMVNLKANKIEIRKAVEKMYSVTVAAVNTMVIPGKTKKRFTRAGVQTGRVSPYKKAIITLSSGETIDFFGDI
ncbi:MAG: 50S ribosomal protein L23 [Saprospiraceae bacterium]|nr:50S ribosomal protein L23 [Saprospiraceae bacterium]